MTDIINDKFNLLKSLISQTEEQKDELVNGKKSASSRTRLSLMKIKTLAHVLRGDITNYVKTIPVKPRGKKPEVVPEDTEDDELTDPPVLVRQNAIPAQELAKSVSPVKRQRKQKPKIVPVESSA